MAIVAALAAAYAIYCLVTMPAGPLTTPDSVHYLSFSPIVPLGYPLFLKVVGARGAMFAQPLLFSAALVWLGRETLRSTRSSSLAVLVVAASMALPQVTAFHASILTESLFMSMLIAILAVIVRFIREPSMPLIVAMAAMAGANATVRRTGYALLPVLLLLILQQRHRLDRRTAIRYLAAALLVFALIPGAEHFSAPAFHGGYTSSLMGRHLFAKAALIEAPLDSAHGDSLREALEDQLHRVYAPIRDLLARAPLDVRAVLTIYYETCLQGACAESARALMPESNEAEQTRALGEVGLRRIIRGPIGFARLTALHFGSLWTVDRLRHPSTSVALTDFINSNRPLPFEREAMRIDPGVPASFDGAEYVRYVQLAFYALAAFTGLLAAIGLIATLTGTRLSSDLSVACIAALAAHGGLLLTALLAAGFSRFLIGLWPAVTTAALFGAQALLRGQIRSSLP